MQMGRLAQTSRDTLHPSPLPLTCTPLVCGSARPCPPPLSIDRVLGGSVQTLDERRRADGETRDGKFGTGSRCERRLWWWWWWWSWTVAWCPLKSSVRTACRLYEASS